MEAILGDVVFNSPPFLFLLLPWKAGRREKKALRQEKRQWHLPSQQGQTHHSPEALQKRWGPTWPETVLSLRAEASLEIHTQALSSMGSAGCCPSPPETSYELGSSLGSPRRDAQSITPTRVLEQKPWALLLLYLVKQENHQTEPAGSSGYGCLII